ncbi:MAG: DMT family transporter [Ardenticatenales bacterium]|nr:DMT family transporter [Ardenticatenales bacterium]
MTPRLRADLALLAVTAVWGATFVMVKDAVAVVPPMTFNAVRCLMAGAVLVALGWRRLVRLDRRLVVAGIGVGLALTAGYSLQVFGLQTTTPARAGFLTGLAVVFVPFLNWPVLRRLPLAGDVVAAVVAVIGVALLSVQALPVAFGAAAAGTSSTSWQLGLNDGDWMILGCAVAFAVQIVALGRYAPDADPMALATVEILTMAVVCTLVAPFAAPGGRLMGEASSWLAVPGNVWFAAWFTGVLATAVAFVVQASAQRFTSPERTALVFAGEPVFAAAASWWWMGERMGPLGWVGGALIVGAMVIGGRSGGG